MKDHIIKLLSYDKFISGEEIARELGVSRTAIWKQVDVLRKQGYHIESIRHKGYRLVSTPDIPLPYEIENRLHTKIIGKKIFYFPQIHSTNNYAKELVKKEFSDGIIIVSDEQTKGRGRKNRSWHSPKGGLWFSIIVHPDIPPNNGMILTMAVSNSIVKTIRKMTGLNPVIKWPNDILINNKKVCGVLTELDAEIDQINYAIIGIGINVNNKINPDLSSIATSLKSSFGKKVSRVELLSLILTYFDDYYQQIKSRNFELIRKNWLQYSNIIGKTIVVQGEKAKVKGIVEDIDETGCILLQTPNGINRILTGDIEYI